MALRPKRIVVGGGSGFVGTHLCKSLRAKGHEVTIVSRKGGSKDVISWEEVRTKGLPKDTHAVVQLAGEGIAAQRWTDKRKQILMDSRIETTKALIKAAATPTSEVKVFVCASAVGYYPASDPKDPRYNEVYDEDYQGPPADNFAGHLCSTWENTILKNEELARFGVRSSVVRCGIVLGDGGAMKQMYYPFRFGLGGVIATGQQYWPWIHIDDIVSIYEECVSNMAASGVFNGVAPQLVTNKDFTKTLGKLLNRPTVFPGQEYVAEMALAEGAYLLTKGQRVVPKRTQEVLKIQFQYPEIEGALRDVLRKPPYNLKL